MSNEQAVTIDQALAQMSIMSNPLSISAEEEGVLSGGELAAVRIARVLSDEFERMDASYQTAFARAISQVASVSAANEMVARQVLGIDQ